MVNTQLRAALGGMANYPRFFVWRMSWDSTKNKYEKIPCYPDGRPQRMDAHDASNWLTLDDASVVLESLRGRNDGYAYTLGWMLRGDTGYWFLDIDHCIDPATRQLNTLAQTLVNRFPGAFMEYSSSGDGLHIFGHGYTPQHGCKNPDHQLELYTDLRGVAFGEPVHGLVWGSADSRHDVAVAALVNEYFPAGPEETVYTGDFDNGPRDDWRGPTDDQELIRRALMSRSVMGAYLGKASFADLWHRNVPVLAANYPGDGPGGIGESEADAALAQHLAFWTGCDAERMERLMRQSAMFRDKWDDHHTYLREFTIHGACARQSEVYAERETVPVQTATLTAPEIDLQAITQRLMNADEEELRNVVVPMIRDMPGIERLDRDRLALLLRDRFKTVFSIPVTLADCRAMLRRKLTNSEQYEHVPGWATSHVYVLDEDVFYSLEQGAVLSRTAFNAKYNRLMPVKDSGLREDAARFCLEHWNMTTVDGLLYAPGREPIFEYDGRTYANEFTEASLPEPAFTWTEQGVAGIEAFKRNLWALCGQREVVYYGLLAWMATTIQRPDCKILHAPLIKGVMGDGKTIIADILHAAGGGRNIRRVNTEILSSSSGFTGWAAGRRLIAIEEIHLTGKDRYRIYKMLHPYITNRHVTIHPKGGEAYDTPNTANYIAFTNHNDALPLEDDDRRWWVIFSPFMSFMELAAALGLDREGLEAHFGTIHDSISQCAGEWRRWLLEMPVPAWFKPKAHAPMTDEKKRMMLSGMDETEMMARDVIERGGYGISREIVSSACLSNTLRLLTAAEGVDVPQGRNLSHMMNRIGYVSAGPVWWDGKTHRVWIAENLSVNTENIKNLLEKTRITVVSQL